MLTANGMDLEFENKLGENKIDLPKGLESESAVLAWVKSEFQRIVDNYGPFDHVGIKQNENVSTRYSLVKTVMFFDCIASMAAVENHIRFESFVYPNLGTNSGSVKAYVESRSLKTEKHWDIQMADAVAVAYHIINR